MPNWAAFAGLTLAVLMAVLVLARRSEQVLRTEGSAHPRAPVVPRFERPGPSARLLLANVVVTQGAVGAIVATAAVVLLVPPGTLGLGPDAFGPLALAVGLALGVGLWLATAAADPLLDAEYDETLRDLLAPETPLEWLALLGVALPVVALSEELLFRAAAIGGLAAAVGVSAWWLVLPAGLTFGLAHGAQGRAGIALASALGVALGAAFVVTESLLVVVVAHYLVNALEFGIREGDVLDVVGG